MKQIDVKACNVDTRLVRVLFVSLALVGTNFEVLLLCSPLLCRRRVSEHSHNNRGSRTLQGECRTSLAWPDVEYQYYRTTRPARQGAEVEDYAIKS